MGRPDLPTDESEQCNERNQLREPETSLFEKRLEGLRFRRQFRHLMQNFLLSRLARRGGRRIRRRLRRGGRGPSRRGPTPPSEGEWVPAAGPLFFLRPLRITERCAW